MSHWLGAALAGQLFTSRVGVRVDQQGYDIIGDIHGHAEKLLELLHCLGYEDSATGYHHPVRKVIFVGDFIDRGEHLRQHRQLLKIVMPMVDNGHALAVMGNHEFNALAFHTLHEGQYLRQRSESNVRTHQAFLNEFEHDGQGKQDVLDFFYRLPLFLDLGGLRVIHACWDEQSIAVVKEKTTNNRLSLELLIEASTKDSPMYVAVELLLKGAEVCLPNGVTFMGTEGEVRKKMRLRWWDRTAVTLGEAPLPLGLDLGSAVNYPIPDDMPRYSEQAPPCFIGHYWMSGEPRPLANNVACLDYSVAKGGPLMAYRWGGEMVLQKGNFVYAS